MGDNVKYTATMTVDENSCDMISFKGETSGTATISCSSGIVNITGNTPSQANEITLTSIDGNVQTMKFTTTKSTVNIAIADTNKNSLGDVNGDGKINTKDARAILRYSAKLDTFTNEQIAVADVNNDGKVNTKDARKILRVAAKLETI